MYGEGDWRVGENSCAVTARRVSLTRRPIPTANVGAWKFSLCSLSSLKQMHPVSFLESGKRWEGGRTLICQLSESPTTQLADLTRPAFSAPRCPEVSLCRFQASAGYAEPRASHLPRLSLHSALCHLAPPDWLHCCLSLLLLFSCEFIPMLPTFYWDLLRERQWTRMAEPILFFPIRTLA